MLGDAGLLVHSFDGWESPEETWHTKIDLSCSLLHQGQHNPEAGPQSLPIYSAGAGFILRPGATPVLCGKAGDSAGQCGRWCPHVDPDEALDESWRNVAQNGDGCGGLTAEEEEVVVEEVGEAPTHGGAGSSRSRSRYYQEGAALASEMMKATRSRRK